MNPTRGPNNEVVAARPLSDMNQMLESADGADERIVRVLELVQQVVPYHECALLEVVVGGAPKITVTPPTASAADELALTERLVGLLGLLLDGSSTTSHAERAPLPHTEHLAIPTVGLGEVTGLLYVRCADGVYDQGHVRALAEVATKLGAYTTMLRSRTALVAIAKDLDQARRDAEAASRAKDELLALVSHELRTPLASILAWASVARAASDAAERGRALDALERDVAVESAHIRSLLDLADVSAAELRLNLRACDAASLIRHTANKLRATAEGRSIRLVTSGDAAELPLFVDPERIGQALSILVATALRFTPDGGDVEVSLEPTKGEARITVKDSGSFIPRATLPHVFDRFPTAGARSGGGLDQGLAVVKTIIELHGGRIRAESDAVVGGATFTIDLPRRVHVGSQQHQDHHASASGENAARVLAGVRVLLVDADAGLRESFRSALQQYGAEVIVVATADEALAEVLRIPPQVMLVGDLASGQDTAIQLAREVTARTTPIAFASISAWHPSEGERTSECFQRFLAKPVEMLTLVDTVVELSGRPPR